jgi:SAM-dependent methyltransferase
VPYYRSDLARVHHLGFGGHADSCAPAVRALLGPVRARNGLVLELGCGSGRLTRHLVDAGHRVLATDASRPMLDLAQRHAAGAESFQLLQLPDDPLPPADAIVSVGHVLSYLPDASAIDRALAAMSRALLPGGILAFDICDLAWGRLRRDAPPYARVADDWVLVTRFSVPAPDRFVREITTFVRADDGRWRRDDERHDNVLIDTSRLPEQLRAHGVDATVGHAFGEYELPGGLVAVVGRAGRSACA